jgi:DNA polymerase-3 subunit delta
MVTFLYGEDDFRSGEKLAEIKNEFLEKGGFGAGFVVFDFEEGVKESDVSDILSSCGLFSCKKMVIIKNLLVDGKTEQQSNILEIIKKKNNIHKDDDLLLIFLEKGMPRKNGKLFKFISSIGTSEIFEKFSGSDLEKWIIKMVKKNNGEISSEGVKLLIAHTGNDLFQINNEIEKLLNYGRKIGEKEINLLVKAKVQSNIFETIEALSAGNKKLALDLLHGQLEKGDDPFYVFSMYVYQFRNLLKIAGLYFSGLSNEYAISKEIKIHPFVVKKGLAQIRKMDLEKIKTIYRKAAELDLKVKTGKLDIVLALDKFVAEI